MAGRDGVHRTVVFQGSDRSNEIDLVDNSEIYSTPFTLIKLSSSLQRPAALKAVFLSMTRKPEGAQPATRSNNTGTPRLMATQVDIVDATARCLQELASTCVQQSIDRPCPAHAEQIWSVMLLPVDLT